MDNVIEDNLPNEEEQQRLRLERLTEIGNLPMEYGILTIVLSPNKRIDAQVDGLAPFELLGALRFVQLHIESGVTLEAQREASEEPVDPQSIM